MFELLYLLNAAYAKSNATDLLMNDGLWGMEVERKC